MKKILLLLLLISTSIYSYSQKVSGTVSDSSSGESLIGAMVLVKGESRGATVDPDGKFSIDNLTKEIYDLEIRYMGYKTQTIVIKPIEDTLLNIQLLPSVQEIGTVVVSARSSKETNAELVKLQSNSAVVMDGTNAETFKKTPDTKASDVFKRISGASVQDNKFVVIRGLSDRYNFALINGSPLPSSESDRKAFSFDIFPSNMLDNLTVMKSGSPDLPGEFSGGVININTTEPKDKNYQNLQLSLGYNVITTFRNFSTYQGSNLDFLGLGSGDRSLPTDIPRTQDFSQLNKTDKANLAGLMSTSWSTKSRMALPNGNLQYSIGRNYKKLSSHLLIIIKILLIWII